MTIKKTSLNAGVANHIVLPFSDEESNDSMIFDVYLCNEEFIYNLEINRVFDILYQHEYFIGSSHARKETAQMIEFIDVHLFVSKMEAKKSGERNNEQ